MRIQGTNFQSLAEFDLDISGLTVLIGPSSKGKSAVFRAIKGLFRNQIPDNVIRNGTDAVKLTATVGDKTVTVERLRGKSTTYSIPPKEFTKLNQTIPPELAAFGMNEVALGEFNIDPIFSRQNGSQFLIDPDGCSPMKLNTVLGAFASTEKLESGKKAANLEIQHKNAEAKTLAEEVNASEGRKAGLETVAREAEIVAAALQSLEPCVQALEVKKTWVEAAKARQAILWPLQALVNRLEVPAMGEIDRLQAGRRHAIQATNSFRVARLCSRAKDAIESATSGWSEVVRGAKKIQAIDEYLASVRGHVKLPVEAVAAKIEDANHGFVAVKSLTDGIILLAASRTWLDRAAGLRSQLTKVDADIAVAEAGLVELKAKIQEEQKIACPACGHKFDPSHQCEGKNARTA
jgi:hypothetical protein